MILLHGGSGCFSAREEHPAAESLTEAVEKAAGWLGIASRTLASERGE